MSDPNLIENPDKIGVGTFPILGTLSMLADVDRLDASWFYDWQEALSGKRLPTADVQKHIPMVWDHSDIARLSQISKDAQALLTFNEPDNRQQANMTVDQALADWPALMATGLRLGSPAVQMNSTLGSGSWLQSFMTKADAAGYRVDFIAVHYYPKSDDIGAFKAFLEKVHQAYDRPIWVTEWALADWSNPGAFSAEQQRAFFEAGSQMMDDLPYVEKHAWFGAYEGMDGWNLNSGLIDATGGLTSLGSLFEALVNTPQPALPEAPVADAPSGRPDRADTVDGSAASSDTLVGSDASNSFFFRIGAQSGADRIQNFQRHDVLVTDEALRDGNGDGIITFRKSKLKLDDTDTVTLTGVSALRLLGTDANGLFVYANAAVRPAGALEGKIGDDVLTGDAPDRRKQVFFFDTALGMDLGEDRVGDFGAKDILVTTTQLTADAPGSRIALADGRLALHDAEDGAGGLGTATLVGLSGNAVSAIEFDGSVVRQGVEYFVYSLAGSAAGVADLGF